MYIHDPRFGDTIYIPSSSKLQQAAHLLAIGYQKLKESERVLVVNDSLKIILPEPTTSN